MVSASNNAEVGRDYKYQYKKGVKKLANVYGVTLSRKSKPGNISEITVTYKVAFNEFEREYRTRFREYIELWGADSGLTGADDFLYRLPTGAFHSQKTTLTRTKKFDVANSILDEDWGEDEVYAKVKVVPVLPSSDTEKSNEITGWF